MSKRRPDPSSKKRRPDPTKSKRRPESDTGDRKQETKEDVPVIGTELSSNESAEHVANASEIFFSFLGPLGCCGVPVSGFWLYRIWKYTNDKNEYLNTERQWLEHEDTAPAFFLLFISLLGIVLSFKRIRQSVYSYLYK